MHLSSTIDSGNIKLIAIAESGNVQLSIRHDNQSEFRQWFHFRVSGIRGTFLRYQIMDAGKTSYPAGWDGYFTCASYDGETWFRVPTSYDNGILTFEHTATSDVVYFAYFAAYPLARHQQLVEEAAASPLVEVETLGETLDGYPLDMLRITQPGENRPKLWVIARQHPGESMAEWWMEGFLSRLLDESDALASKLRELADWYVVPNMNPDGTKRGHLRTNAAGVNLNREWQTPSLEKSPEVFHVLSKMDAVGCDFFLDVHGDEELPYNFVSGSEGVPAWGPRLQWLQETFLASYMRTCPDFQTTHGYPVDKPGQANLTIASNQIAERFDCLSMTLEMPFKDNADAPDPQVGWSPERSQALATAVFGPIQDVLPFLRGELPA